MKPNTIILGWPNAWRKREEESWRVFVDTIRNTAAAKMALLVPKGVQRYPDSGVSIVFIIFYLVNFLFCLIFNIFKFPHLFLSADQVEARQLEYWA